MEHKSDGDTNCNWCTWNNHQRDSKGTGRLGIRGQVKTIQTTALLRSARILKRVLEIKETGCHTNCSEKLFGTAGRKNSQKSRTNN